ncbi:hypothetical protein CA267_016860 [Alteromonas pelagimontana]|uniref:Uncharacterized protein n=1 Tax=Alteromonas pelagimontana TaxID=1858656 RepID=A0A6M4MGQ2_9ALTE|nr:hypothetical protein [Alteromonas pelagimontana]QJR82299.1 hypothetical protein CA267_016860 [Alteromonas pelagimontana]
MKFLKPKYPPQPNSRFQKYLQSQPVFNWFDRYEKQHDVQRVDSAENAALYRNWMAKRVGE